MNINRKLDERCCTFAGVGAIGSGRKDRPADWVSTFSFLELQKALQDSGEDPQVVYSVYPPVSTNWGAAGRLSEALESIGIRWTRSPLGEVSVFTERGSGQFKDFRQAVSPKGLEFPMALALAVAEIADKTEGGKS